MTGEFVATFRASGVLVGGVFEKTVTGPPHRQGIGDNKKVFFYYC